MQINGNCGEALSCGIIARSAGIFENAKRICACDGVTLWDERNKPLVGPERQTKLWKAEIELATLKFQSNTTMLL